MAENSKDLTEVVNFIHKITGQIETEKAELGKQGEMLKDALSSDPNYCEKDEKVKEATKERHVAKKQVLALPELAKVDMKIKDSRARIKDLNQSLSEYLQQYERLSGQRTIEGADGQLREIVYTARLVKN